MRALRCCERSKAAKGDLSSAASPASRLGVLLSWSLVDITGALLTQGSSAEPELWGGMNVAVDDNGPL